MRAAVVGMMLAALAAPAARGGTIVALAPGAPVPAGAAPVAPALGMWLVPGNGSGIRGVVAAAANTPSTGLGAAADPLQTSQWWLDAVGADRLQAPGPGKLVAIVDSGVDTTHPEFSATSLLLLNQQRTQAGAEEHHGTAVASIVGARADGRGVVGVYPGAALASWDNGAQTLADVLGGVAASLSQPGPGVINISVGFDAQAADLLRVAVDSAVAAGWLVVAAAGNSGHRGAAYPAALPHVLTVGATDRAGNVAPFSSRSRSIDVAAPGVGVLAAVPTWKDASGFAALTGTSFAAPIVSGAAAWLWTLRPALEASQVAEMIRRSSTDVDAAGFDVASGWGLLNVPAALAARPPIRDPQEPNDDVDRVSESGLFGVGTQPLVDEDTPRNHVAARLDAAEDPADVYRVYVPPRREIAAEVERGSGVQLALWGPNTQSLHERTSLRRRDRIVTGRAVRTRSVARVGAYYYLAVTLRPPAQRATYLVSVSLRARR